MRAGKIIISYITCSCWWESRDCAWLPFLFCAMEGKNMATTRIIPMHQTKGKTVAQCLSARTDYAKNPDKTNAGELVSSFGCDPKTVDAEFVLAKREYRTITGAHRRGM